MVNLIFEIKKKREFSGLPDSIVEKVLFQVDNGLDDKSRVKEVRSMLRKYFGVFLTNRVIKPKDILNFGSVLKSHRSSMKRDYDVLYGKFKEVIGEVDSVVDFGCGVNGFSYEFLKNIFGEVKYIGMEASNQIVENMNSYFSSMEFDATAHCVDLFDLKDVNKIIEVNNAETVLSLGISQKRECQCFFCFQLVDALEKLERNSSKKFLLNIKSRMSKKDWLILSLPMVSLSSKSEFKVKRNWLFYFLNEEFSIVEDFRMFGERFVMMQVL